MILFFFENEVFILLIYNGLNSKYYSLVAMQSIKTRSTIVALVTLNVLEIGINCIFDNVFQSL